MYGELGIGFQSWHVVFLDIYNVFELFLGSEKLLF
jgi:hypothetical protein